MKMEQKNFFNWQTAKKIADKYSTPCYVYDESALIAQAKSALAFPNAFGLTVRYAMKASSNASILKLFHKLGLHIDASSGYEVERAMLAGFEPNRISISSQQLPQNLKKMVKAGVLFNACSLHQLEEFGKVAKGKALGFLWKE